MHKLKQQKIENTSKKVIFYIQKDQRRIMLLCRYSVIQLNKFSSAYLSFLIFKMQQSYVYKTIHCSIKKAQR